MTNPTTPLQCVSILTSRRTKARAGLSTKRLADPMGAQYWEKSFFRPFFAFFSAVTSIESVKQDSPHGRNVFGTIAKSMSLTARSCCHLASRASSAACSIGSQGALKT